MALFGELWTRGLKAGIISGVVFTCIYFFILFRNFHYILFPMLLAIAIGSIIGMIMGTLLYLLTAIFDKTPLTIASTLASIFVPNALVGLFLHAFVFQYVPETNISAVYTSFLLAVITLTPLSVMSNFYALRGYNEYKLTQAITVEINPSVGTSRERYLELLDKAPDVEPEPYDKL